MISQRTVIALGLAAAVAIGGAAWQWQKTHSGFVETQRGERLLPGLLDKANEVAAISVRQGQTSFRIIRNEDASYRLEGSDYPVRGGRFQSAIVAAASLERFEAKTAREDKHTLIEVDDPAAPDAKGRLVTFEDKAGNKLAEIILGRKARGRVGGAIGDGQYVRLPGEAQSWLARGVVEGDAKLSTWVDTGVVEMNIDKVVLAAFKPEGGEELVVRRVGVTEGGQAKFEIDNVPEGRKPQSDLTVRYAATDIANSQFIDVRKDQGGDPAWRTRLMMEDGMLIEFNVTADDWLSVKVLDGGKDKETSGDILKRTGGYQFRLEDYKIRQFQKTMADLTEPAT
ncbi:MAG: hypothetical protein V2I51_12165 [Anderseniella sp.]|jgi:hypothetical protein|nr:hypothetical protein [Anderseniella sp.]